MTTFKKVADEVLDYAIDWSRQLALDDDTIEEATWVADGLSVGATAIQGPRTVVWVSGGVVGATATLTCTVTTAAGRTYERRLSVQIRESL